MENEPLQLMLRKKLVDMKTDNPGFYTETFNIVSTLIRLTPAETKVISEIQERISHLYKRPSAKYGSISLAQFEDLYWKFKGDATLKIKGVGVSGLDIYEIKSVLDKIRRDMLFYLALIEEPKKNYDILMETEKTQ